MIQVKTNSLYYYFILILLNYSTCCTSSFFHQQPKKMLEIFSKTKIDGAIIVFFLLCSTLQDDITTTKTFSGNNKKRKKKRLMDTKLIIDMFAYQNYMQLLRKFKALTKIVSAIGDPVKTTGYSIKWHYFDILASSKTVFHCKVKQTVLLKQKPESLPLIQVVRSGPAFCSCSDEIIHVVFAAYLPCWVHVQCLCYNIP